MLKFRVRQIIPCLDYQDLVSRKIIPDDIFLKNKLPPNIEELRSCFSKIGAELQKRQQNYSSLLYKIAACMEGVEEMTADMEKEQCEALVDKAKFPFWVKSGGPVFGMFVELLIQNFLSLEEEKDGKIKIDQKSMNACLEDAFTKTFAHSGRVSIQDVRKSGSLWWKIYHFCNKLKTYGKARFGVEYSTISLDGHPDQVTDTVIFDVKTSRNFATMRESTILQLLSYYALCKNQHGDDTPPYVGVILPMTSQVLTHCLIDWDHRPFLAELNRCVVLAYQVVFLANGESVGSHTEKKGGILPSLKLFYNKANYSVPCQIFITSPKANIKKALLDDTDILQTNKYVTEHKIRFYIHAPYLINLSSKEDWPLTALTRQLEYGKRLGARGVVVHMGSHKGTTKEKATGRMKKNVLKAIESASEQCPLLLETSVGEGSEILWRMSEFFEFYDSFSMDQRKRLKLCIDTCHVFAAGYNPVVFTQKTLERFGPRAIALFHMNDSKGPCRCHKDEHIRIGHGYIGTVNMLHVLKLARDNNIDCVSE